ncbi:hypothetical protein GCM10009092_03850 [Bowmanella denitrificans]|uniref:Uncharacterized protein n=1 Tax=Bowmanella denitrificans TaxID=366582 RepID=A0ABP3GDN0_9ALTE
MKKKTTLFASTTALLCALTLSGIAQAATVTYHWGPARTSEAQAKQNAINGLLARYPAATNVYAICTMPPNVWEPVYSCTAYGTI